MTPAPGQRGYPHSLGHDRRGNLVSQGVHGVGVGPQERNAIPRQQLRQPGVLARMAPPRPHTLHLVTSVRKREVRHSNTIPTISTSQANKTGTSKVGAISKAQNIQETTIGKTWKKK